MRESTSRGARPRTVSGSRPIQTSAIAKATAVNGTLTRNAARQPNQPTSRPPIAGPTATVTAPAMARPPSTFPGGACSPIAVARRRISSIAAG